MDLDGRWNDLAHANNITTEQAVNTEYVSNTERKINEFNLNGKVCWPAIVSTFV